MTRTPILLAFGALLFLTVVPVATVAAPPRITPVHVGEIGGAPASVPTLDRLVREEIDRHPRLASVERRRARLVVRGSVVDCSRRRVGRQHEVRCEVSWVVTSARTETVELVTTSAGTARGAAVRHLEEVALRAAARGLVAPLTAPRPSPSRPG